MIVDAGVIGFYYWTLVMPVVTIWYFFFPPAREVYVFLTLFFCDILFI
jgi:hypothetical protein